jgi:hypothetical protein
MGNVYSVFVRVLLEEICLPIPRRRFEDNIKIDIQEIQFKGENRTEVNPIVFFVFHNRDFFTS